MDVTVPHKHAALAAVTDVDEHGARIGAVNTVWWAITAPRMGPTLMVLVLAKPAIGSPRLGPQRQSRRGGGGRGCGKIRGLALADAGAPELRILNRTASRAGALAAAIGDPATPVAWDDRAKALEAPGFSSTPPPLA